MSWSPELKGVMESDKLLSTLRTVFAGQKGSPLYKTMRIGSIDKGYSLSTYSYLWIDSPNYALGPL